jgi:hypothetical protein
VFVLLFLGQREVEALGLNQGQKFRLPIPDHRNGGLTE